MDDTEYRLGGSLTMLDISVECRLAQAGIPASRSRLEDRAAAINGLFLECIGRPEFIQGTHSAEVYCARFSNEDAAREAMAWAEFSLSDMRVTPRGRGATLTGIMGKLP